MSVHDLMAGLDEDPQLRSTLMYFPERVAARYSLTSDELEAIKARDFSRLQLTAAELARIERALNYHGI